MANIENCSDLTTTISMWMNEEFGNNIGSIIEFKILHIKLYLFAPCFTYTEVPIFFSWEF